MWCVTLLSVWCRITTSSASEMTTDQACGDGNRETRRFSELYSLAVRGDCCSCKCCLPDLRWVRVIRRFRLRPWEALAADPLLLRPPFRVLVSKPQRYQQVSESGQWSADWSHLIQIIFICVAKFFYKKKVSSTFTEGETKSLNPQVTRVARKTPF